MRESRSVRREHLARGCRRGTERGYTLTMNDDRSRRPGGVVLTSVLPGHDCTARSSLYCQIIDTHLIQLW